MAKLFIPKNYEPLLDLKQTEHAIKTVKDHFQTALSAELRLRRVTAPLFVMKGTGINDDLNGTERPVAFPIKEFNDEQAEVVHSLAKWKRMMLADYEIEQGYGLYTDMNAIRPDEELSNIHSLYVDQWDWERHIGKEEYNLDYLKHIVRKIYEVMKRTEFVVFERYPSIQPILPEEITFIQAQDLLDKYPDLTPKEREDAAAKEHGAIFIIGIGGILSNGEKHDGRAPDYDDWSTPTADSYKGLNGDIVVWNPILERSFEISSMGIRVSPEVLSKQLDMEGCPERKELLFHQRLLDGELPLSIGGGIGQSRLCMFFLRKAHIGEIQSSIWPADMRQKCKENKIILV
ncbi:aspartate--ammonia ligase [Carboxylicivirga mesophila]|uniref:Aspartate--ammonia ligase n=1 Tax=Carboxylicivirga mesophila TaxID=1166478 RepID=A0ABS5KF92_9BACT|nr:aspartate--ammonia ligase [Carboxylicivirga mesophila]MBS2213574.1 aspartate--ammonia ligase [Carboxylicivirga mesophila]